MRILTVADVARAGVDDAHTPEAHAWARSRSQRAPTLLLTTDPARGLTPEMVEELAAWCV